MVEVAALTIVQAATVKPLKVATSWILKLRLQIRGKLQLQKSVESKTVEVATLTQFAKLEL